MTAPRIHLADYSPPAYLVDAIALDVNLNPEATRVRARLEIRRQGNGSPPLRFDGVGLRLTHLAIDGRKLDASEFAADDEGLTLNHAPAKFILQTEVELNVAANESLVGLYLSDGRYCTQCEAEGFRRITYFPDRPDVLARYRVRIEADRARYPSLLSNGNLIRQGELTNGRHYVEWYDPYPKPSYLFALVAGEFEVLSERFTTASGRNVELRIHVEPGQRSRAVYAMDALKRAMRWDEQAFGREYDLELFMIVAVRDFNYGAMENKGLNLFSSALVLADALTATDEDYARIERIVAHEYFHNWTGDRITCRDWFQLCLKEGLTVFREQLYCEQQRGASSERLRQVQFLRTRQFPEDLGELAHPVRPASFVKIDNFYTATVYEKGAELVRLLRTMVGEQAFRRGMDLYFERCDGTAATVEEFISCFSAAGGTDLSGMLTWYGQAGLPRLRARVDYDLQRKVVTLRLSQQTPPTNGQPLKQPAPIPVRFGVLDEQGVAQSFAVGSASAERVSEAVIVLTGAAETLELSGIDRPPVMSLLRGFSAPVLLELEEPARHRFVRFSSDPDRFNRWQAGQDLARELIFARISGDPDTESEKAYASALRTALGDEALDSSYKAHLLRPPSEHELSLGAVPILPGVLHRAREAFRRSMAQALVTELQAVHDGRNASESFSPDALSAGDRALSNVALDLLATGGAATALHRVLGQFRNARNMTDSVAALSTLARCDRSLWQGALDEFRIRWQHDPLVIDKWFAIQAAAVSANSLERVTMLSRHPDFHPKNPERLRSLVTTFTQDNLAGFHRADGAGYRFLADQVLSVDRFNPIVAARLMDPFGNWRRYESGLSERMRTELERILAERGISANVRERAATALHGSREGSA